MAEKNDPMIGTTIRNYVLIDLLGRGAMGVVYLGRHSETGSKVGVKFLSDEFAMREEFVTRFMNEAAASSALDHENIIHVYETGKEEGMHFMIMEYVDGVDLTHFLEDRSIVKESQAIPWIKQAARGLGYAHSRGIVHRDLKPENIMLTKSGKVKIADMGLSKNLVADENLSMTMSGTTIGTPYYISPEQVKDSKRVDSRADIYSLGATFYHLVTGGPAFDGNSATEVMSKHMNQPLVSPQSGNPKLSGDFCDLIMMMMEKDPSKRFQTMEEVVAAIERMERGEAAVLQKVKLRSGMGPKEGSASKVFGDGKLHWKLGLAGLAIAGLILFALKPSHGPVHPKSTATVSAPAATVAVVPAEKPVPSEMESRLPEEKKVESPAVPPPSEVREAEPPVQTKKEESPNEEETLHLEGSSLQSSLRSDSFNWIDALAGLVILVSIPLSAHIGVIWGVLRAFAVWVAIYCVFHWFGDGAQWLQSVFKMPEMFSVQLSFFGLSLLTILPAWIVTHRLVGHQKDSWQFRLSRRLSTFPGVLLGMALALWVIASLAMLASESLPIRDSWIGSRMALEFPSIQPFLKSVKTTADKK